MSRATATAEEWAMLKGVYAAQSTARQMHLKQELTSYASQWSSSRTMCLRASLRARERADAEDAHPEEPAEAPASPVTSPAPVCCASGERRAPAQVWRGTQGRAMLACSEPVAFEEAIASDHAAQWRAAMEEVSSVIAT